MRKDCSVYKELKRILLATVIVAAIAPLCLQISEMYASPRQGQFKRFSSYEELKSFIKARSQARPYWGRAPYSLAAEANKGSGGFVPDYSKTNIQVEGVDEADIVKTDGEYIYIVSGKSVFIVKAYPAEEAEVLSQIDLNGSYRGMFINGESLVILEERGRLDGEDLRTFIKVYDVSDRGSPDFKRDVSLDGGYFNSRMIGDYVYAVLNQPAYFRDGEVNLPKIYSGDCAEEIHASTIYYSDVTDSFYAFTTIIAVNVQNHEQKPTHKTFLLGASGGMYVSLNNIYITISGAEGTLIHRFHIEGNEIECAAKGEVPGYTLNQFSMDEYEGYFRLATTTGHLARSWEEPSSRNHIYVLDRDLRITGKLEDLAPGERIYSARFMGDRCYLVTFRKVDPLFVIDLKDPSNPMVLGKLKIPGYSDYLHPYDEKHIIGIGKETVAAEEGDFSWYQGVKISLFDISDVEKPKEIAKYIIGDRGTDSPVLRDHKALLFDAPRNLLVIPVLVAEIHREKYPNGFPPYTYGDYVWQGAYVFTISPDEGLVLKGRITHLENAISFMKSGYYFSSTYSVKRSLYIDNVLYTISDTKIKMNNLENLDQINEVVFP